MYEKMMGHLLHLILWFYCSNWHKLRSRVSSTSRSCSRFPPVKVFFPAIVPCFVLTTLSVTNVISIKLDWLEEPQPWSIENQGRTKRNRKQRKHYTLNDTDDRNRSLQFIQLIQFCLGEVSRSAVTGHETGKTHQSLNSFSLIFIWNSPAMVGDKNREKLTYI